VNAMRRPKFGSPRPSTVPPPGTGQRRRWRPVHIENRPPLSNEDDPSWCVPATELQDLVSFLASPGVLPIIAGLAAGPSPYGELLRACPLGLGVADDALSRLEAFDLITRQGTPPQQWCSLTTGGHELLEPLAGFAAWSREALRDGVHRASSDT